MASTDPDELYTLRNLFWLGSFQQAINEGGRLNRLSDELKVERDEFVYRSYVGQGQYALVISEVDDDAPVNLRAVKLLAEYLENPSGTRDGVVGLLAEGLRGNHMSRRLLDGVELPRHRRDDIRTTASARWRRAPTPSARR